MPDRVYDLNGTLVFECAADGPPPASDREAVELIGAAWAHRAAFMVIPAERLGDQFFRLKTGLAGQILQKFVQYRMPLAIVGDFSRYTAESSSLRDFIYESNRGPHIWFLANLDELQQRLPSPPQP